MELMVEIKRCNYFKEVDRAKLNYVKTLDLVFSFDLIVQ
jgi:hypothetical protein